MKRREKAFFLHRRSKRRANMPCCLLFYMTMRLPRVRLRCARAGMTCGFTGSIPGMQRAVASRVMQGV